MRAWVRITRWNGGDWKILGCTKSASSAEWESPGSVGYTVSWNKVESNWGRHRLSVNSLPHMYIYEYTPHIHTSTHGESEHMCTKWGALWNLCKASLKTMFSYCLSVLDLGSFLWFFCSCLSFPAPSILWSCVCPLFPVAPLAYYSWLF